MAAEELRIVFEKSSAIVSTVGAALVSLILDGHEVVPKPSKPHHPYHGVQLAPWPNRIAGGRYSFNQTSFELELNEAHGNALHGLAFSSNMTVVTHEVNLLVLTCQIETTAGYPFGLEIEITFALSAEGLTVSTSALNTSSVSCPVGMGTHPFFVFDEQSTLEVFAKQAAIHGSDMMPLRNVDVSVVGFGAGVARSIENLPLDTQFAQVGKVCAVLRTKEWAIQIWQEQADWLMVYTTQDYNWSDGRTRAVAIEPQTCAADAFNNGEGLVILEPAQRTSFIWGVKVVG